MKTYPSDRIRNVVLVGHGGAGKTSLTEALLHAAGAINRPGRVEDGNTVSDFDPYEVTKGISISLSLAPFEWKDHKINLLDAPGYADFVGDAEAGIRAADAAIIVISAVEGLEVQARVAWDIAEHLGIPRAFFINKLDRERASFQRTMDELTATFGNKVAPCTSRSARSTTSEWWTSSGIVRSRTRTAPAVRRRSPRICPPRKRRCTRSSSSRWSRRTMG